MTKNSVCTIVTSDFIPWALAMYDSLSIYVEGISFDILIIGNEEAIKDFEYKHDRINWYSIDEVISDFDDGENIKRRISNSHILRWVSKSLFQLYLYKHKNHEKIIYVDGDIHFYNDISFIWELLENDRMLLTPHWISIEPTTKIFEIHNSGLYNAGFMASNLKAIEILEWWLEVCLFKCISHPRCFNYDQGYLDVIPVYFEGVSILRHKGCNVAYWNADALQRYMKNNYAYVSDGENEFPLVFYHFGRYKFDQFIIGPDQSIYPLLISLNDRLHKYDYKDNLLQIAQAQVGITENNINIGKRLQNQVKRILPFEVIKKVK